MTDQIKIAAIMSLPRLGWNDAWGCVHEALEPFRIPVRRFYGVFWGQCMQRAFNDCVKEGIDWILTIDYDSVFSMRHVDSMIGMMGDNPHIDALAALQTKRCEYTPLMGINGKTETTISSGVPLEVDTAHFGLTLIRTEPLKRLSKPWFLAVPSAAGEWDEDRIDEDIYFWNLWKNGGNTVFINPDAKIGHLEVVCSTLDDNFQFKQTSVTKWKEEERERVSRSYNGVRERTNSVSEARKIEGPGADSQALVEAECGAGCS